MLVCFSALSVAFFAGAHALIIRPDGSTLIHSKENQNVTERCTTAAMRDAQAAWLSGRVEEMQDNPCVDNTEVLLQKLDQLDLDNSRRYFSTWHGYKTINGATTCKKTLLPAMVYLGQGHTGSTTLAMQLDAHPELSYGKVKEHHWGEEVFSGNGHVEDYTRQFRVPCETRVAMDFSPGEYLDGHHGSHWHTWQRERKWLPWLRSENPDLRVDPAFLRSTLGNETKLIIMLRDPVEFLDSLPYWWKGHVLNVRGDCYALGVEKWLDVFPREQILFIQAEHYFRSSQQILDKIFKFLNVSAWTYPEKTPNSGRRRTEHTIALEDRQAYFSKPFNRKCKEKLEHLTGMKFHWKGSE